MSDKSQYNFSNIRSIRNRFITTISLMMVGFFLLLLVGTALLGVARTTEQVESHLLNDIDDLFNTVDLRLSYLQESTQAFSASSLAINSLIDVTGRSVYFPQAIKELSELDEIESVVAFDFSGRPIATSKEGVPLWFNVSVVREALSVGVDTVAFLDGHGVFIIVAPIEYLQTQQGGIAVAVNADRVFRRVLDEEGYSYRVMIGDEWSASFGEKIENPFFVTGKPDSDTLLSHFQIQLESMIPASTAREPVISALREMLMLGLIGMLILIFIAMKAGRKLADPIRKLVGRIHDDIHPCGPVGTGDELEILAESFDLKTQGLLDVNSHLEQRVAERTSQLLNQTNELELAHSTLEIAHLELQELDRMKDEFISTVSHELRTPLTSIYGVLSIVANGVLDNDVQKRTDLLKSALSNSERLKLLINDLLDVQKLSSGNIDLHLKMVNSASMIDDVIKRQEGYASQFGVTLVHSSDGDEALFMDVDEHRIQQVFDNLISNAIKFSPSRGVVEIASCRVDDEIKISIRDYGKGVPKGFQHKIFTRFSQADGSSCRKVAGTGLGLNICKWIVEAHNGTIGYENPPEGGALFWFKIPVVNKMTPQILNSDSAIQSL